MNAVPFVETSEPDWVEEPPEHSGRLVVVCGLPGSGKTTLGRRLEVEHGATRLSPDEWMAALEVDVIDERTRTLVEQLQWQLAQRLLQLGQLVVIEWGTWAGDERDALRKGARALGAAVELRFLDQPDDVLWDRVRARDAKPPGGRRPLTRAEFESYAASFQRPDPDELSLYDAPNLWQATNASVRRCDPVWLEAGNRRRQHDRLSSNRLVARSARCDTTLHGASASNGDGGLLDPPMTLVLEGRARAGADEAVLDGVKVVHAPGEGDDTIAAIAEAHDGVMWSRPTGTWQRECERPAPTSSR